MYIRDKNSWCKYYFHWSANMGSTSEALSIIDLIQHQQRCQRQLQWLLQQSHQLSVQYNMWQVRHQRACQQNSSAFRYNLHLRLITVKGLMTAMARKMEQKATELMALSAFIDAMDIMDHDHNHEDEIEWNSILHQFIRSQNSHNKGSLKSYLYPPKRNQIINTWQIIQTSWLSFFLFFFCSITRWYI